jgi:hypothetical protein
MVGMTFPAMRKQLDIQREHDMLMFLMDTPELFEIIVPREYRASLRMATDVLCWVLHHDVDSHSHSYAAHFAEMLKDIREVLDKIAPPGEPPEGEYIVDQEG